MYCECLPLFNYLTFFVTIKSEKLKKTFILVNIKNDIVYVDSFLLRIFLYNFNSLLDKMIRTFNVLNAFYYWSLVTKCDKSFVHGKSKRKWLPVHFYLILKITPISTLVSVIVIKPKFLFYAENIIITISVKRDKLHVSNHVIIRVS